MRLILGLDAPSSGSVTVGGRPYATYRSPLFEVGAMLEAKAFHGGRSARNHLLCLALSNGISRTRVDQALDLVGLASVARKRAGGFSLGMGQRLGIVAALLGDPQALMLDEPVNGLDPDGIRWVRTLVRGLAAEGRTVLLSSHLISEMALTADQLVVIGRGHLVAELSMAELAARAPQFVKVRSPEPERLAGALRGAGMTVAPQPDGSLSVTGAATDTLAEHARAAGISLHELTPGHASLEDVFMALTTDSVEYRAAATTTGRSQ